MTSEPTEPARVDPRSVQTVSKRMRTWGSPSQQSLPPGAWKLRLFVPPHCFLDIDQGARTVQAALSRDGFTKYVLDTNHTGMYMSFHNTSQAVLLARVCYERLCSCQAVNQAGELRNLMVHLVPETYSGGGTNWPAQPFDSQWNSSSLGGHGLAAEPSAEPRLQMAPPPPVGPLVPLAHPNVSANPGSIGNQGRPAPESDFPWALNPDQMAVSQAEYSHGPAVYYTQAGEPEVGYARPVPPEGNYHSHPPSFPPAAPASGPFIPVHHATRPGAGPPDSTVSFVSQRDSNGTVQYGHIYHPRLLKGPTQSPGVIQTHPRAGHPPQAQIHAAIPNVHPASGPWPAGAPPGSGVHARSAESVSPIENLDSTTALNIFTRSSTAVPDLIQVLQNTAPGTAEDSATGSTVSTNSFGRLYSNARPGPYKSVCISIFDLSPNAGHPVGSLSYQEQRSQSALRGGSYHRPAHLAAMPTYHEMIGLALIGSTNQKLTSTDIRKWTQNHFPDAWASGKQPNLSAILCQHRAFEKQAINRADPKPPYFYCLTDEYREHYLELAKSLNFPVWMPPEPVAASGSLTADGDGDGGPSRLASAENPFWNEQDGADVHVYRSVDAPLPVASSGTVWLDEFLGAERKSRIGRRFAPRGRHIRGHR